MNLITYHSTTGVHTAFLVTAGRKFLSLIVMDSSGLRVRRVPRNEERYVKPLDYPVKRAARRFLKAGRSFGISKAAKGHLLSLTRAKVSA